MTHPVRHQVKTYKRHDGTPVRTHMRGTGAARISYTKKPSFGMDNPKGGPKAYTVNFKYSERKGDGESVPVIAASYDGALAEAIEEKTDKRHPVAVEIIDPSIGSVLSFVADNAKLVLKGIHKHGTPVAKKAASIGAKYAIKGGAVAMQVAAKGARTGADIIGHSVAEYTSRLEQENVQKLIQASYSADRGKKVAARATLKNFYPEIYDMMEFSTPKFSDREGLKRMALRAKRAHKRV